MILLAFGITNITGAECNPPLNGKQDIHCAFVCVCVATIPLMVMIELSGNI